MKSILGGGAVVLGLGVAACTGGRAADGGTGEFSPLGLASDDGSRRDGRRSLSIIQRRNVGGDRRPILEAVKDIPKTLPKLEPRPRAATRPPE